METHKMMIEYARLLRQALHNPSSEELQVNVLIFETEHEAELEDFWLRWRNPGDR